jgi:hypothetical protein
MFHCKSVLSLLSLTAIKETNRDSAHPPHIGKHIRLFQKPGSAIDDKIRRILQIKGTYHILFGFFLTIKKQPEAIIRSLIIWLFSPVSVRGVQIESVMPNTIIDTIRTPNASSTLTEVLSNFTFFFIMYQIDWILQLTNSLKE